eukprot:scaffold42899_cov59-Phaeocystis_antarctica.AAC.1
MTVKADGGEGGGGEDGGEDGGGGGDGGGDGEHGQKRHRYTWRASRPRCLCPEYWRMRRVPVGRPAPGYNSRSGGPGTPGRSSRRTGHRRSTRHCSSAPTLHSATAPEIRFRT